MFRDLPAISTSDPTSASVSASTTTTIKHETSPATSYAMQVQHGGDIPSDGIEHQVTIAKIPLETERLEWVCVPRLGGQVWLQVGFKRFGFHVFEKLLIISVLIRLVSGEECERV